MVYTAKAQKIPALPAGPDICLAPVGAGRRKGAKINLRVLFCVLAVFSVFAVSSYLSAKELEDYGYTKTEHKEGEYSRDLINKKSPYLQEIPKGPSSLE